MYPGKYNLIVYQGSLFNRTFLLRDEDDAIVDISAYDARMQIRYSVDSTSALLDISSEDVSPMIVVTGSSGKIEINLTPTVTTALNFLTGVWDLEIYNSTGSAIYRVLEGIVRLSKEVTRVVPA